MIFESPPAFVWRCSTVGLRRHPPPENHQRHGSAADFWIRRCDPQHQGVRGLLHLLASSRPAASQHPSPSCASQNSPPG